MGSMIQLRDVRKSGKPNQYLAAPDGYLAFETADETSPVFPQPPAVVFETAERIVRDKAQNTDVETEPGALRLSYVARIAIFKDDVDLEVVPSGDGASIVVFSRSRVGYSDLGANRRRLQSLLSELASALGGQNAGQA